MSLSKYGLTEFPSLASAALFKAWRFDIFILLQILVTYSSFSAITITYWTKRTFYFDVRWDEFHLSWHFELLISSEIAEKLPEILLHEYFICKFIFFSGLFKGPFSVCGSEPSRYFVHLFQIRSYIIWCTFTKDVGVVMIRNGVVSVLICLMFSAERKWPKLQTAFVSVLF